jgi:DNA-directed RNA polymerase subunit N (RpoN/RPB10)
LTVATQRWRQQPSRVITCGGSKAQQYRSYGKKRWNKGRVFYYSIGHILDDLKIPQVTEILRRGFKWAADRSA